MLEPQYKSQAWLRSFDNGMYVEEEGEEAPSRHSREEKQRSVNTLTYYQM